jgi:hypothetical protein
MQRTLLPITMVMGLEKRRPAQLWHALVRKASIDFFQRPRLLRRARHKASVACHRPIETRCGSRHRHGRFLPQF